MPFSAMKNLGFSGQVTAVLLRKIWQQGCQASPLPLVFCSSLAYNLKRST